MLLNRHEITSNNKSRQEVTNIKRILLVAPYYFPQQTGGAPHVYRKLQELSDHEILIYTDLSQKFVDAAKKFDATARYPILRVSNITFHSGIDGHLTAAIKACWHVVAQTVSLIMSVIKYKPHFICCGAIRCVGWLCYFAAKLTGCPLLCYVHGEELTIARGKGVWSKFSEWGEGKVLRASKRVFAVSRFTQDKIVTEKGCNLDSVAVVNNGTDTDLFFPAQKSQALLEEYGLVGKKVLVTLTRLEKKKGVANVIKALPVILEAVPDLVYLVGGTGSELEGLNELIQEMGLRNNVKLVGFVPDELLNDFMNLGDVFILANHSVDGDTEGFGLVFLQANACGIPVIGGNDGGTPDAIEHGASGFLIDATDERQIVDTVTELMNNEPLRSKMGLLGRTRVVENFPWVKKVFQFDEQIKDLTK